MKKILFLIFFANILFLACKQEDVLIDEYSHTEKYLIVNNGNNGNNRVSQFSFASQVTTALSNSLPAPVLDIKYFRGYYYLLLPEAKSIYIIQEITFEIVSIIDYSILDLTPVSICFPNATDAYVAHSENQITIIDLTNFKIANTRLKVGENLVNISGAGNQVYVCSRSNNMIYIIDSRTNLVEDSIKVSTSPRFVEFNSDGATAFVLCSGETLDAKTQATLDIINVSNRSIINTLRIGSSELVALETFPTGIAISPKNIYISASNSTWRVALPAAKSVNLVNKISCNSVGYDKKHNEFYLLTYNNNNSTLITYSNSDNKKNNTYSIPQYVDIIISQ